MRPASIALALLPFAANAINVVMSNDDGWAEINLRVFYDSLTRAGFNSIISAPAIDRSGTGSRDEKPGQVDEHGCEYGSCPPESPPYGRNESMPRFNYVNSYPVTSMRYGIQNVSKEFFGVAPDMAVSGPNVRSNLAKCHQEVLAATGSEQVGSVNGAPDIAVAGPNIGTNLGITTQISGTVGAANEAVKKGFPAIAFSGRSGHHTAWNAPVQPYMSIYANLSTIVTQALTQGPKPYLPKDVLLNVNFAAVDAECSSTEDFKFVLTRVYPAAPWADDDVETCGGKRLPVERSVVMYTSGCYSSISVMSTHKGDVDAETQGFVLKRLESILSCLPSD